MLLIDVSHGIPKAFLVDQVLVLYLLNVVLFFLVQNAQEVLQFGNGEGLPLRQQKWYQSLG